MANKGRQGHDFRTFIRFALADSTLSSNVKYPTLDKTPCWSLLSFVYRGRTSDLFHARAKPLSVSTFCVEISDFICFQETEYGLFEQIQRTVHEYHCLQNTKFRSIYSAINNYANDKTTHPSGWERVRSWMVPQWFWNKNTKYFLATW